MVISRHKLPTAWVIYSLIFGDSKIGERLNLFQKSGITLNTVQIRVKAYIELVFQNLIEPNSAEKNPYWTGDESESDESIERRVQTVLDNICKSEA